MSEFGSGLDPEFHARMSEPFVWQNTASIDKIPKDVRFVVDDLIGAIKRVYGDNGALYLHGSSVSGAFREGASDIDALWIAYDEIPSDHQDRRKAELEKVETRGVVGYLDATAMPVAELADGGRKSAVFACAYNGVKVAGSRDVDFTDYLPKTKGDYFSCQYSRFGYIVQLCREGYDLDTLEQRSPRSLAKSLARALYHDAYFRGCPYEQGIPKMQSVLVAHGFSQEAAEFGRYVAMSQRTMTEAEKQEVFTRAEQFVPVFARIVEANATPYGLWVKDWLEQQG